MHLIPFVIFLALLMFNNYDSENQIENFYDHHKVEKTKPRQSNKDTKIYMVPPKHKFKRTAWAKSERGFNMNKERLRRADYILRSTKQYQAQNSGEIRKGTIVDPKKIPKTLISSPRHKKLHNHTQRNTLPNGTQRSLFIIDPKGTIPSTLLKSLLQENS